MPHPLELNLRTSPSGAAVRGAQGRVAHRAADCDRWPLLALADGVFHFQDRGLRAIFSLALLTATVVGVRWVVRAERGSRYRDVQLAQRVEQFYPQLRGRLASSIEFLRDGEDDPLAGSAELRGAP